MDFRSVFPIVDFNEQYTFVECKNAHDFLNSVIQIYFSDSNLRIQQACLSVYMAYRDHYPSYLVNLNQSQISQLNLAIEQADPKIIRLRRIVLSQLSKVA